jgi:hypothetical protein
MRAAAAMVIVIGCAHGMPPEDPRCAGGELLFQGDNQRDGHDIRVWISTAGAWAYAESGRAVEHGCLDAAQLAEVNAALSRATWSRSDRSGDPICDGHERSLQFRARGQLVYTMGCGDDPDDATGNAIVEIFATVNLARRG